MLFGGDDDGMPQRMLLVTFFLKYYIDLIKAWHLYILESRPRWYRIG